MQISWKQGGCKLTPYKNCPRIVQSVWMITSVLADQKLCATSKPITKFRGRFLQCKHCIIMLVCEHFGSVNYTLLFEHFYLHKEQNLVNQNSVSDLLDGVLWNHNLKKKVETKFALWKWTIPDECEFIINIPHTHQ